MALKFFSGFEIGDVSDTYGIAGTTTIQSVTKRSGGYAAKMVCSGTEASYVAMAIGLAADGTLEVLSNAPNYHTFYFRVALLPAANNEEIASFSSAYTGVNLRINTAGNLLFYSNATLIATGATALSLDTWYRIDVKLTSGGWEVRINGVSEISGATSYVTNTRLNLGKVTNRNSQSVEYYYDDYFLDGAAYTTADAVGMLLPNGDGTHTAFTNDYTYVDEVIHDSGTTYVESTANGQKESTNMQSLSDAGISGTVFGVIGSWVGARAIGATGTITVNCFIKSGVTESATTDDATLAATYDYRGKIYTTDPNTSAAWTNAAVDALEVGAGFVTRSSDRFLRVTALKAMIAYTASAASGPANLKAMMGLAKASIKTIDQLAIASVKTVDGLN